MPSLSRNLLSASSRINCVTLTTFSRSLVRSNRLVSVKGSGGGE